MGFTFVVSHIVVKGRALGRSILSSGIGVLVAVGLTVTDLSIFPCPVRSHSGLTSGYVAINFAITSSVIPVALSRVPLDTPILV